ncbi:cell division protein ZapA [Vagococcus humatus]|uniref:Cell division protein ZapA n=1 Tax=Vagococcus humatus TaxID=1889241 RepID=A0A3S0GF52_9ENTE|nr:cell division protein ZapA [Vagococcus humatus]RST90297.1 cell division protein ZapA [Vagococcus humatus]
MGEYKNRYKANIAGESYTIIGNETKEHMDVVTEIANRQLEEIKRLSSVNLEQAAVLLAINAISDQVTKQEQLLVYDRLIEEYKIKLEKVDEQKKEINFLRRKLKRLELLETDLLDDNQKEVDPVEVQKIKNQQALEKIQESHLSEAKEEAETLEEKG